MPRLSQNFLCDSFIRRKIIDLLGPYHKKTLLEIGPGQGFLTKELIRIANVIAVEKDERLLPYLKTLPITLYHKDILEFSLDSINFSAVVSNIPYHITKPLLLHLQKYRNCFTEAILMVQKEVAAKLCSAFADSFFTASIQSCFTITEEIFVPKTAFSPIPQVDSAVIRLEPKKQEFSQEVWSLVKKLYQKKRKKIGTVLQQEYAKEIKVPPTIKDKRPDAVPIDILLSALQKLLFTKGQ